MSTWYELIGEIQKECDMASHQEYALDKKEVDEYEQ